MRVLGLTGGIASGKSTVARYLRRLGAGIVDADACAHALSAPHAAIWEAYVAHFGSGILRADGELDRAAIARIVFADDAERRWIDDASHPIIRRAMDGEIASLREAGKEIVFLDVPLLYEVGWESSVEAVWVAYVPREKQQKRLMRRGNCSEEEAARRIAAQMDIEEKRRRADVVINNSGAKKRTFRQVEAAWDLLLREPA